MNTKNYAGRSIARQFCCFVFIVLFWLRKSLLKRKKRTPFLYQSSFFFICGGAKGTRTPGLCVANASLYQLSYNPAITRFFDSDTGGEVRVEVVEVGRIELPSDTDRQGFLQV